MSADPLNVVLCWHMHQPEYRDQVSGEYLLPWTYLHGIKDYVDMAAHLNAHPQARAVVNFAPVLLDQIADYAAQVEGCLEEGTGISDPLLAALVHPALPLEREHCIARVKACLRTNRERMIERFAPYRRLAEIADTMESNPTLADYLDPQYFTDLLVWYHLAWLGETVRRADTRVKKLMDKGAGFTLHDRRVVLTLIGELLGGVLQDYRQLAEQGRVELAMSPYAHPIVPLMLDLGSAREAMPDAPVPRAAEYPGGAERARWHIHKGRETFRKYFGFEPAGCWPSEGSVSDAALALLEEEGFRWAASGQTVLENSLVAGDFGDAPWRHRPFRRAGGQLCSFFRDDGLSDLIGFTYADWHADDAVANFVHNLENIAREPGRPADAVVSVILDGENAWEYYPENGYYFLGALYDQLSRHPELNLTTFSGCLDGNGSQESMELKHVVAGSWVYGTFSTWIGDNDKNRGWDMLCDAKHAFDRAVAGGRLQGKRMENAQMQLAICEGSDWFWWFGDYNPADTVSDFERLFRHHLSNLYQVIGEEPPEYLSHTFTHGSGHPARDGVMRQSASH